MEDCKGLSGCFEDATFFFPRCTPPIRARPFHRQEPPNNYHYDMNDHSELYRIAMVLHPSHKLKYFKSVDWKKEWVDEVEGWYVLSLNELVQRRMLTTRTNLIPFKPLRMTSSTRFRVTAWEELLQQVVGSLLIDPASDRLGFQLVCSLWLPEPLFFVPRGMAVIVASEAKVARYISKLDIVGRVAIAVYNGPESHIVSGEPLRS